MPQSLIDADVSSHERRETLKPMAKAALDLAAWAAEGRCDYFLAAQLSMLVRRFSQVVDVPPHAQYLPDVLDFLGASIQMAVGKATKPEGTPAASAVAPVEETVLQPLEASAATSNG